MRRLPRRATFRDAVIAAGIDAGPLQYPFYLPLGEFSVHDPDGYGVMIAQHEYFAWAAWVAKADEPPT